MKRNKFLFVLLLLVTITLVAFGSTFLYIKVNNEDMNRDSELLVMTSCNPVYVATLNVVGDCPNVIVENLSQPTTGCLHDYSLTAKDMKRLSKADVLVINGDGMEGYLDDVLEAYPELTIIDATANEDCLEYIGDNYKILMEENSHVWLSLFLYDMEIDAISKGLCEISPENADAFINNAADYRYNTYKTLEPKFKACQEFLSDKNVVLLHEAYEYVAEDLKSEVVGIMDLDEERQVSAGEVADLIDTINDNNVQIVLAERDYGSDMGQLIERQTTARVVYLQTLIHGEYDADSYVEVMESNYDRILESLYNIE